MSDPPRFFRPRITLRRMMAIVAVLSLMMYLIAPRSKNYTHVSLSHSNDLRDVAEPIRMVKSLSFSDGGSHNLVFLDSKNVTRIATIEVGVFDTLRFGDFGLDGRELPVGGIEERAFLGLLQRWVNQDREAQAWLKKWENHLRSRSQTPFFTGSETPQQRTKAMAVIMMRTLRARN